jgi:hypothetical protein
MRDLQLYQNDSDTPLDASDFNALNSENENIVTSADITLDPQGGPNSDLYMLSKAVAAYGSAGEGYSDSGSANAYVLTRSTNLNGTTKYYDGMKVIFLPANSNTSTCTINVNSIGVKNLKGANGDDLIAGDIIADEPTRSVYDSGSDEFRLLENNFTNIVTGSFKNKFINGSFNNWQQADSQTSSGYGSDDRWSNEHSGSTKTHSKEAFTLGQTEVPNEPKFFSRTVVTSSAGAGNYCLKKQCIESVRTFAGQSATLRFYAKADASKNIAVEFIQNFGTGGSPSSDVTAIGVTTIPLTTSIQEFIITVQIPSISGKTLGTDLNDWLGVIFWFDAGSNYNSRTNSLGQQSGTFDLAEMQLEAGRRATRQEKRSDMTELELCRYYLEVITPTNDATDDEILCVGQATGANDAFGALRYTYKRDYPSITLAGGTTAFTSSNASGTRAIVSASPTFGNPGRRSALINWTDTGRLVAGDACRLDIRGGARIIVNAELG